MPVPASPSVQQARQAIAQRLRTIRLEAGHTARSLGAATGWHGSKVSKIEHVKQLPSPADIRTWCQNCSAVDETAELLALMRAADEMYVEYRRTQLAGQRQRQESYATLDETWSTLRAYEMSVVPGIIQTPDYARATMKRIAAFNGLPDNVEAAVQARTARARYLRTPGRRFAFVIEAYALTHNRFHPDVMAGQLVHLIGVSSLRNVTLGIIPPDADRPVWSSAGFWIFDDNRVLCETPTAELAITQAHEVQTYARHFVALSTVAMHGAKARAFLTSALDGLGCIS